MRIFDDVARLGPSDGDRPVQRVIASPGALHAPIHLVQFGRDLLPGHAKALEIARVPRRRFESNDVAGVNRQDGLERRVEEAAVDSRRRRLQLVCGRLALRACQQGQREQDRRSDRSGESHCPLLRFELEGADDSSQASDDRQASATKGTKTVLPRRTRSARRTGHIGWSGRSRGTPGGAASGDVCSVKASAARSKPLASCSRQVRATSRRLRRTRPGERLSLCVLCAFSLWLPRLRALRGSCVS